MRLEIITSQPYANTDEIFHKFLLDSGFSYSQCKKAFGTNPVLEDHWCKYPEKIYNHPKRITELLKTNIKNRITWDEDYFILTNDVTVLAVVQYMTALYKLDFVKCHMIMDNNEIKTTTLSPRTGSIYDTKPGIFDTYDTLLNYIINIASTNSNKDMAIDEFLKKDIENMEKFYLEKKG